MQYSSEFQEKFRKLFPRAKGMHMQLEAGRADLGDHIDRYLEQITEEQFGRTFNLSPDRAQEQFPDFLADVMDLKELWIQEVSAH